MKKLEQAEKIYTYEQAKKKETKKKIIKRTYA